MASDAEQLSEADEVAALLPWYVTGRIAPADKARIETYAKAHPDFQKQIAIAREEADAVFAANQEIHVPHGDLDKLMKGLAESPAVRFSNMKASLLDRLGDWLDAFTPRQLAYAAIAALALFAIQTGTISALLRTPHGTGFETASKGETLGTGTFVLVGFQPAAPQASITSFLAENKLAIVEGPRAGGLYRLRVSSEALSDDAAKAIIDKLKSRADLVAFATPAPSTP